MFDDATNASVGLRRLKIPMRDYAASPEGLGGSHFLGAKLDGSLIVVVTLRCCLRCSCRWILASRTFCLSGAVYPVPWQPQPILGAPLVETTFDERTIARYSACITQKGYNYKRGRAGPLQPSPYSPARKPSATNPGSSLLDDRESALLLALNRPLAVGVALLSL